ncbi:MAG: pilus assembly protein PilB [Planctomycetales bacterium]|nr:pilus assembly protein PilB [Planctomycetales bacterium]NIM08447.1 pilus assembly protein PilB [Planctomycetales bacterium]NIN07923.1 pilus assembly protein PilB [Planctomycetales bacterium]NIN77053.1 pilus assembly protein PilB [Planctomycetales bacterium]NIO34238.1 pilus assembly protein PilB [Planctomycetales bacterium]
MAVRRIGQILVDLGFIDEKQLEQLLMEQHERPTELIGQIAMDLDMITDIQLAQGLAEQMGLQVVNLEETVVQPEVLSQITEPMAQLYRIVPVAFNQDDHVLTIAMCDPQRLSILDELRTFLGYDVRPLVATESDVLQALDRYYAASEDSFESLVTDMEEDEELSEAAGALTADGPIDLTSVEALADSAPVRKLLNMVLLLAIKDHASDLHFEPFEDEFRIRVKADGILYEMVPPPRHLAFAITTRIKVMANLDIAERRMPQDGRIELTVGGHPVDLRVSVLPTMFGESVVLRILDRTNVDLDLVNLGMPPDVLQLFRQRINKPNGIVLVTGPTGSGKTTTLYGALVELNKIEDKLITTEDPVEYDIDGLIQCPIDTAVGNTFASCLRAILRQDPDKILVGEIRDLETAEIAVQASLTGHLVFSTLHTNDAPSTITRLRNMGVPPFLITATLEAVLAQRLVRRICSSCKEETSLTPEMLTELQLAPEDVAGKKIYKGRGCDTCNNTGYRGRVGLYELMEVNDEARDLIIQGASTEVLRESAKRNTMIPLRDAGLLRAFEGVTTVEEIIRETILEA